MKNEYNAFIGEKMRKGRLERRFKGLEFDLMRLEKYESPFAKVQENLERYGIQALWNVERQGKFFQE